MLWVTAGVVQASTLFLIDDFTSPYNTILGYLWIQAATVITSTYH